MDRANVLDNVMTDVQNAFVDYFSQDLSYSEANERGSGASRHWVFYVESEHHSAFDFANNLASSLRYARPNRALVGYHAISADTKCFIKTHVGKTVCWIGVEMEPWRGGPIRVNSTRGFIVKVAGSMKNA